MNPWVSLFIKHKLQLYLAQTWGIPDVTALDPLMSSKPQPRHIAAEAMVYYTHWKPQGRRRLHLMSIIHRAGRLNIGCRAEKCGPISPSASMEASGRAVLTQHLWISFLYCLKKSMEKLHLHKQFLLKSRPLCSTSAHVHLQALGWLRLPWVGRAAHSTTLAIKLQLYVGEWKHFLHHMVYYENNCQMTEAR